MIYQQEKRNIPDSKRTNACTLTEAGSTTIISNSIGQGEVHDSNSTSQYDGNSC
jgi:hypothetical protein